MKLWHEVLRCLDNGQEVLSCNTSGTRVLMKYAITLSWPLHFCNKTAVIAGIRVYNIGAMRVMSMGVAGRIGFRAKNTLTRDPHQLCEKLGCVALIVHTVMLVTQRSHTCFELLVIIPCAPTSSDYVYKSGGLLPIAR